MDGVLSCDGDRYRSWSLRTWTVCSVVLVTGTEVGVYVRGRSAELCW